MSVDPRFQDRLEKYTDEYFPLRVEFAGTAYPEKFTDEFTSGDRLYDPVSGKKLGGPLKRDNVGIHTSDLIATAPRWNQIVDDILGDNPISFNPLPVCFR